MATIIAVAPEMPYNLARARSELEVDNQSGQKSEIPMIMSEPPLTLDGARVLYYCSLGMPVQPTGQHTVYLEDGSVYIPANVAICRYLANRTIYRFYCDDTWNVITDIDYSSIEAA